MSSIHRQSKSADAFLQHIFALHSEIRSRINMNNESYKYSADLHRCSVEFKVGDYVMVCVRPERFPRGIAKKLQARDTALYKVLERLGPNAYLSGPSPDMGISPISNVEVFFPF